MATIEHLEFLPCTDDPDDFRPDSTWAFAVDPEAADDRYVRNFAVIVDRVAPGDRVPLHTHDVDELVIVQEGSAQARVGDDTRSVSAGALLSSRRVLRTGAE